MQSMEQKYEDRLELIRKMHETEILQIRQINQAREKQLEDLAVQFHVEKTEIVKKIKQEAKAEEKRKREKF